MKSSPRNIAAASLLALSMFSGLFFFDAPKANAQLGIGVVELGPASMAVLTTVAGGTTVSATNETIQTTIKQVLDGLAWTAAKTVVQSITQSIVTWINSGFQGSPAFVTDLNRNFSQLGDAIADDFITMLDTVAIDSTGISVRAPFQDQIAAQLREEFYRTTSSYGFDIRNPYTLGNVSNNPEAFTRGDFRQGGISGLYKISDPKNNPYGRYQMARNELTQRLSNETRNQLAELGWGKGFLSWRGPCGANAKPTTSVNLAQKDTSRKCGIRTPGAVIENALGITATSPIRQLELADSINEIVAALMGQMVNQIIGPAGLSGVSRPSAGGGQSFLERATSASQYSAANASLATGFAQTVSKQRQDIEAYRSSWQRIADVALTAEQTCRRNSSASEARQVLEIANTNISRATSALVSITGVEERLAAIRNLTVDQSAAIAGVVSEYQAIISGSNVPTATEAQQAKTEATDTGSAQPGSLYSQMERLTRGCRLGL